MENFKVGDKVRIRSWESMRKVFGINGDGNINTPICFTEGMKYLCGKTAIISLIDGKEVLLMSWDTSSNTDWYYCTDMLEPAEKNEED